ncbi:MAG: hypothetical protein V7696_07345 [Halioglobus sp.]
MKQAGSLGLPYLASPLESLAVLQQNYRIYREALVEAGQPNVLTVPVMRSVFVSDNAGLLEQASMALQASLPKQLLEKAGDVNDWAIVGDRHAVRDRLQQYQSELGITHLIARGRVASIDHQEQSRSLSLLLDIVGGL